MKYARMFEAALQLFPKKIKVTFIHAGTGNRIGIHKISSELLPQQFNKPVTIEANGSQWRVLQANPANAEDYLFSKKLTLHVQESALVPNTANLFLVPTVCHALPGLSTIGLFNDFILDMEAHHWRQMEFLPVAYLPDVQEEIKMVEQCLAPGVGVNLLLGFPSLHTRVKTGGQNLSIPFDEFCNLVGAHEKGAARFSTGFVQNGFAVRSANYIYYGTVQGTIIKDLCLYDFDCVDDEFIHIVTTYGLILADWCNGKITMGGGGEEESSDEQEVSV